MSVRGTDPNLSELLLDALSEGQPSAELLVRYADDPGSLSAAERQQFELELSRSPELRDQLAVLRRFPRGAAAPERQGAQVIDFVSRLRRRLPRFQLSVATLVPLAAAAALIAFLVVPTLLRGPDAPPAGGTEVAATEREVPQAPAPETPKSTLPAEIETPPAPAPTPVVAEPAPTPAPVVLAQQKQTTPPKPTPAKPEPALVAKQELEDLIAAVPAPEAGPFDLRLPDYSAPTGADSRYAPSGVIRGTASPIAMIALGPNHVGRTILAQPNLYWYLDAVPDGPGSFEFTIAPDHTSPDILVSAELPKPTHAGLQAVRVSDFRVSLAPGVVYRWSVAFQPDPEQPSASTYGIRWIVRVPVEAPAAARLETARPVERPSLLVVSGLWYDALANLTALIDANTKNPSLRAARAKLLRDGGLEDPALSDAH